MSPPDAAAAAPTAHARAASHRRTVLAAACAVHVAHDGFTDALYALLPLWRAEFALGYAAVGALRGLFSGAMATLQVPAALLAERLGGRALLVGGTLLTAAGYAAAGWAGSFVALAVALTLSGAGSSVQHPIASTAVSQAYAAAGSGPRRVALGAYNFAGDLGKTGVPAAVALLLATRPWRSVLPIVAGVGVAAAAFVAVALRGEGSPSRAAARGARAAADGARARQASATPSPAAVAGRRARLAFPTLLAIGVLDNGTRTGFLTFLPFVLLAKGGDTRTVGLALALAFAGGAAGKLACGWLGARLGPIPVVWLTEGLTAAAILAVPWAPLGVALALLPLLGMALNGTSSVLYGSVPELVPPERHARAFGIFYTGTIGAGAVAPTLFGAVADAVGARATVSVVGAVVLLTLPLAWVLRPAVERPAAAAR